MPRKAIYTPEERKARKALRRKEYTSNNKQHVHDLRLKRWVHNTYGITYNEKLVMLGQQEYACLICRSIFKTHEDAYVDHNHTTNKVRGLLCHHCNLMLGHAKDNLDTLASAINYLTLRS